MWHAELTLEMCMEHCKDYVYWGTEYGTECYCGNKVHISTEEAPLADCNMVCGGDSTQYCGAGSRIELYSTTAAQPTATATVAHAPTATPFELVGCWTDSADRTLSRMALQASDMTIDKCAAACKGYRYFGVENGAECWCGTSLAADSESAPLEECDTTCAGDEWTYCGAPYRLELYRDSDAKAGDPEQPALAGDYVLVGCQTDHGGNRSLKDKTMADDEMSNELCATFCQGFKFFGTEYGRECWCGNELQAESQEAPAGECNMICSGSKVEFCGAGDRLSVYKLSEDEEVLGN